MQRRVQPGIAGQPRGQADRRQCNRMAGRTIMPPVHNLTGPVTDLCHIEALKRRNLQRLLLEIWPAMGKTRQSRRNDDKDQRGDPDQTLAQRPVHGLHMQYMECHDKAPSRRCRAERLAAPTAPRHDRPVRTADESSMAGRLFPTLICALVAALSLPLPARADCVVLLHGLNRGPGSMSKIGDALKDAGYRVVNDGYPSGAARIQALAPRLNRMVAKCGAERVDFVTHSMGGIVLRAWLAKTRPANLGRVVMLAPPNHGSEVVDRIADWPGAEAFIGPAGMELGTGGIVRRLPQRADFDLGVIAGDRSVDPTRGWMFDGPNDNAVSVASTRLAGMADQLVVHRSHTFIMNAPQVIAETLVFLQTGRFSHAEYGSDDGQDDTAEAGGEDPLGDLLGGLSGDGN